MSEGIDQTVIGRRHSPHLPFWTLVSHAFSQTLLYCAARAHTHTHTHKWAFHAPISDNVATLAWATPPVRLRLPGGNSGKIPERPPGNALRVFPGIPLESTAGIPQTLQFKAFEASRAFPEFSPPQYGWGTLLFSEVVPERAPQSRSWNSQQYWGCF